MNNELTPHGIISSKTSRHTSAGPDTFLTMVLMVLELVMGFAALTCGGLLVVNGLGMPKSTLDHSPFDSFLIPGLLLALVVGGSMLEAARMTWFERPLAPMMSLIAGGILLGWIVIEIVMVHQGRVLQVLIALYALLVIRLAWTELRHELTQQEGER